MEPCSQVANSSVYLCVLLPVVWVLPKWIYVVSLLAIFRVTPFGQVSLKMVPEKIALDDLVGVEDAKALIQEVLHRVNISKHKELDWGILDEVLLYGPPGTGKTTLVHAIAREAKVPFFSVSARDIPLEEAGRVEIQRLFMEARSCTPSIVYIKDIDEIPTSGRIGIVGAAFNKLCHEMDKRSIDRRVMVIATTDRPEKLDRELMNSFYVKMHVGRPNTDSRRKFIGLQLNKFLKEEDREPICNLVASQSPGLVWGHLRRIANISLMLADIREDDYVTMDDVLQALEKIKPDIHDDKPELSFKRSDATHG